MYAVTPFNFTAIAGNLPTAPALMGNTVVWKPSPHAVLSAHRILELLTEAGLPEGVINLVLGDAELITREVLAHPDFSGLHFTGSTAVLRGIWTQIARDLARYKSYPRVVGESGGKDFIVAHPSADLEALSVGIVRGGFEYQGQKCSAASRVYVPSSIWPSLEARLRAAIRRDQGRRSTISELSRRGDQPSGLPKDHRLSTSRRETAPAESWLAALPGTRSASSWTRP